MFLGVTGKVAGVPDKSRDVDLHLDVLNLDDDRRQDIGRKVAAARLARGWGKEQAAREAGVSSITWKRVEDGLPVRDFTLMTVLDSLGFTGNVGQNRIEAQSHTRPDEESDAVPLDVVDAIIADPYLLPEAKEHFLNQYLLLLQVHRPDVSRAPGKVSPTEREITVAEPRSGQLRSLPAVAHGASSEHAEQVAELARKIRARMDRERDEDGG